MSKFNILAIAAFTLSVMLMVEAARSKGTLLMNPAMGSTGYITRAATDLLSETRDFLAGTLGLGSVKIDPEPAILSMIGFSLVGLSLFPRKPRRG